MSPEVKLVIFIVVCVVLGLGFFAWFFFKPIQKLIWRHNLARMFYSRVMKVARNFDFYLVNGLTLPVGEMKKVVIDHIIGGDKFIYVITDRYFEGAVNVKMGENSWVYYKKGGKKEDIPNPFFANKFAMERLSIASGINTSFLVGIVLINDDCFISGYSDYEGEPLLVNVGKLEKLIALYEKKPCQPFKKNELWQTIHDLHELGEKNHD
jgi:hypothetical protein